MSLKTRYRPSFHQSGPSAGPSAPPNPSARSLIGCEVSTILSSSGASRSMRFDSWAMGLSPPRVFLADIHDRRGVLPEMCSERGRELPERLHRERDAGRIERRGRVHGLADDVVALRAGGAEG